MEDFYPDFDTPSPEYPLEDWADEINQQIEEANRRALEPLLQFQEQLDAIADQTNAIYQAERSKIERRSVHNVKPWTKEALGKPLTPEQYLRNPEAQIKTIDHKLSQYFGEGLKATGDSLEAVRFTASKWYSGKGSLKDNARPQFYNGAKYPSIKNYADSVKEKFEREKNR